MSTDDSIKIEQPSGASLIACLGFLFDQIPVAQRAKLVAETMRQAARREILVFAAKQQDRFVAACAAQLASGDQALVRPPRMQGDVGNDAFSRLWAEMESELSGRGATYFQVSLPMDVDVNAFEAARFQRIARLSYLEADVASAEQPTGQDVALEAYCESDRERLAKVIELTYEQSQDCPNVDGMRSLDSVIEGYRQTGEFREENWFFVVLDGKDVGCLLLTDHPITVRWELVYMGLNVEVRGRGLGTHLAEFARWRVQQGGGKRLVVAVDSNNSPAISAYTRAGFDGFAEQQVLAKSSAPTES